MIIRSDQLGAPFTILKASIPVSVTLRCNCGGDQTTVEIVGSQEAACPTCGKGYNATFNGLTQKLVSKQLKDDETGLTISFVRAFDPIGRR